MRVGIIMANLSQWYDNALSPEQYRATDTYLKEGFDRIYDELSVSRDEEVEELKDKDLKVLAVAEPWCAHCMLNIPILLRIAEAENFDVRFALRDQNMDLIKHYQTNGKNVIPKFIILDQDGNEKAVWGPIAPYTKEVTDKEKRYLPSKDAADYETKVKDFRKKMVERFSTDEDIWMAVYDDIKKTLLEA